MLHFMLSIDIPYSVEDKGKGITTTSPPPCEKKKKKKE